MIRTGNENVSRALSVLFVVEHITNRDCRTTGHARDVYVWPDHRTTGHARDICVWPEYKTTNLTRSCKLRG